MPRRIALFLIPAVIMTLLMTCCTPSTESVERSIQPTAGPVTPTLETISACGTSGSPEAAATVEACSMGGAGVFTPQDVRCYLAYADPAEVQVIDEETVVLLADPETIAERAGAVIIYHKPTLSMLVLDRFGDVDPQASIFCGRAGVAAISELADEAGLMAGLKRQVQQRWQTTPSNEPEIRLGAAWQEGPTTILLISISGLAEANDRFYCPSQTWTIGDSVTEVAPECTAHEAGTPVSQFLFVPQQIRGNTERPVRVALNGHPSNVVLVREGTETQETAVYRAVMQHLAKRILIVRSETAPSLEDATERLGSTVDLALLKEYLVVNLASHSLRFLFQDSSAYLVHSSVGIARDYLPAAGSEALCEQFRGDYPGLGGVVTLSRIGYGSDGTQALVHVLLECGPADRRAAFLTLARSGEVWQVTEEIIAATALPVLAPEMVYVNQASGCGDILVYKANRARSEYVLVGIDAKVVELSTEPVALEQATHTGAIMARIDVYADSAEELGQNPYCNDVGPTAEPQSVWKAVSGTVTVTVTVSASAQTVPCEGEPYQASVLIEDVVFELGDETVRLPSLLFDGVTVGWCAG